MTLVVEHHEELELDLLGQGIDLLDFWRGLISFRRMQLLITGLADTSRYAEVTRPEQYVRALWGPGEYLQAAHVDMFGQANFKNYKPLVRPVEAWQQSEADRKVAAFLAEQAERNRLRDEAEAAERRRAIPPSKRRRA